MNNHILLLETVFMAGAVLLSLTGCSYINSSLKADPAADSGFIQNAEQMTSSQERFPFDRVWCLNQGCDWSKYSSVVVSPVDTAHLLKMSWWDNFNLEPKSKLQEERHIIARYLRESFLAAIQNDANKYHEVVEIERSFNTLLTKLMISLDLAYGSIHSG